MTPDWLPAELDLSGPSIDATYAKLFAVFEDDFINSARVIVDGDEVVYNTAPDPVNSQYPRGFTHLVTAGDGNRAIDFDRAKKIPWVRAVMENYIKPEVKAFWVMQAKGETLYLWLQDYDFIVILSKMKGAGNNKKIILTAYHIYSHNRRYYQRLLDRASKVL